MNKSLIFDTKSEKEVINLLKEQENGKPPMFFIDKFTCKCNADGDWIVAFRISTINDETQKYDKQKIYKLRSKLGGIRRFCRLNGVLRFMQKVGVDNFTVLTN